MKATLVLLIALLVIISSCNANIKDDESRDDEPRRSIALVRGVSGLGMPGHDQFKFTVEGDKPIQVLMKLNKTLLSMETQTGYNRYIHYSEDSNLAEFRYYKTCITLRPPSYSSTEDRISLTLIDASDSTLTYSFKLDKIILSPQEKIDLMFDSMSRDIAELKEKLWFLEPGTNKIGKGRLIQSNDPKMVDLIEGRSSTYSGIYNKQISNLKKLFMVGNRFAYCTSGCGNLYSQPLHNDNNYYTSSSYYANDFSLQEYTNPLVVRLPRSSTVKKIRFEISNGGSCPYMDITNFVIKRYYIDLYIPTVKYTTGRGDYNRHESLYLNELLDPEAIVTQKKLNDGFVEFQIENEQHLVVDGFALMISSNQFNSSGISYDGSCNYILRNLVLV